MAPQVVVVMRTRDRAILLRRALASVAAQTFRNFQLVVVNDGGDPSAVDTLLAGLDGIGEPIVVHNAESVGREQAVNVGVKASTAPFVSILDDDDTWAPGFLEMTTAYLARSDDGAVAARAEVVFEEIDGENIRELRRELLRTDVHCVTLLDTLYGNFVPSTSMVVRRELFDSLGGWDGSLPVLADWDFTLKVLTQSSIGFIDGAPLVFWHRRETQTGPLGNSVHAASDDHVIFTSVVRDGFLKADAQRGTGLGDALVTADAYLRLSRQLDLARQDLINHGAGNSSVLAMQYPPLHEKLDALSALIVELHGHVQQLHAQSFPARLRRAVVWVKSGVANAFRPSGREHAKSTTDDHSKKLK
jgi:hypothetical protein